MYDINASKKMATDAHRNLVMGLFHMISADINWSSMPHYLRNVRIDTGLGALSIDVQRDYLKRLTLSQLRELLYSFILFNDVRKDKPYLPSLKLAIEFIEKDLAAQELGKNVCKELVCVKKYISTPITSNVTGSSGTPVASNITESSGIPVASNVTGSISTTRSAGIQGNAGNTGIPITLTTSDIEMLKSSNAALRIQSAALRIQLAKLDTSYQKLINERNTLITNNQDLRTTNKMTLAKDMQLRHSNDELRLDNDRLRLEVNSLNSEAEKSKKRLDDLNAFINEFINS